MNLFRVLLLILPMTCATPALPFQVAPMEREGSWSFWMVEPTGKKEQSCVVNSCGRYDCPATSGSMSFYGDVETGRISPEFDFLTRQRPGTEVRVVVGDRTFVLRQKYKQPEYFADPLTKADGEALLAAILELAKSQPKASFEVIDARGKRALMPVSGLLKSLKKMEHRCGIKVP